MRKIQFLPLSWTVLITTQHKWGSYGKEFDLLFRVLTASISKPTATAKLKLNLEIPFGFSWKNGVGVGETYLVFYMMWILDSIPSTLCFICQICFMTTRWSTISVPFLQFYLKICDVLMLSIFPEYDFVCIEVSNKMYSSRFAMLHVEAPMPREIGWKIKGLIQLLEVLVAKEQITKTFTGSKLP